LKIAFKHALADTHSENSRIIFNLGVFSVDDEKHFRNYFAGSALLNLNNGAVSPYLPQNDLPDRPAFFNLILY